MSSQELVSFAEAPFDIIDGDRGKNYPKRSEFTKTGHCLFLSATNVTKAGFSFSECQFIDSTRDAALNKGKLQRDDIVLTTRGTIGNTAYYNAAVPFNHLRINSGMVILRCEPSRLLPAYLYHFVRSPNFFSQVNGLRSGVAQPQLPIRDMRRIKLPLPSLPTQRKIAGILSAYDDLIENNLRRIRILEDMAQSLYREWFIHFRYSSNEPSPPTPLPEGEGSPETSRSEHSQSSPPSGRGGGEGRVKLVDSPLGPIPEGWEVKKLGKIADVNAESIRKNSAPDTIHYIDIKSVSTGSIDEITPMAFTEAPSRARRIVRHGDVIWSTVRPNRRSFAVIIDPIEDLIASTGFAVISPRGIPFTYLYQTTTTQDFTDYLVNHTTGAAYPAVNAGVFENADILVPPAELLARFNEQAEPNQLLQHNLHLRNQTLRQTRNLLLPKLLSGDA